MKIEQPVATVLEAQGGSPGRVAAWMARRVEVAVADVGLTLPQYRVLSLLGALEEAVGALRTATPNPAHASELADRLAVRRPTMTAVIDGLAAKGLVERRPAVGDRRRAELLLTEDGRSALGAADLAVDAKLTAILDCLEDPEDRRLATDGLEAWGRALAASRRASLAGTDVTPADRSRDKSSKAGPTDRAGKAAAGAAR